MLVVGRSIFESQSKSQVYYRTLFQKIPKYSSCYFLSLAEQKKKAQPKIRWFPWHYFMEVHCIFLSVLAHIWSTIRSNYMD